MKSSSLRKASLSATDFQLSHIPCKNKALAEENADLRAKVAQLIDEKEKWQIKYLNLNMKISDFSNYKKDVKHLLQRMSFYLQNFLVVRDMLVCMLQQEADYEEVKDHNTKSKQKAETEQVSSDQNKREEEEVERQQQHHHLPQNQSQNTTVNTALQSSSMHNLMQKCVSKNDHPKEKTQLHSKEIQQYNQLIDFGHFSQQNKVWSVSEEKPVWNVEQEGMLINETMQKSRLSNKMECQGVCMSMCSGNDSLKQSKFHSNGQHEQHLEQNEETVFHQLQECSLECKCLTSDSHHHVHCHLAQVQNMSHDKNLKQDLPQDQLLRLQKAAPLNCYPSQQSLFKGQQESLPDQFDQENNCKAHKQRNICIKEMEQQVLEEQKLEDKSHQSLESNSKTQYCRGIHRQHADLQETLQTEHELLNTVTQKQKFLVAQRPSHSDVQGQFTTDKAQHFVGGQSVRVTANQGIKLKAGKGQTPRNKELQSIQEVDHPLRSDRKQQIPIENREPEKIHKALQTVEDEEKEGEKRTSLKLRDYLASANDELHSIERDQGSTGNQETSVRMSLMLPVKLPQLIPARLRPTLSFGKGQKNYQDKEELQSSESKLQLSPIDKQLSMVQRQKHTKCEKQHDVKQQSKKQVQEHNIKEQEFTSIKVQQQNKCPPFSCMKDPQQPTVEQNQQLVTVPHLTGKPVHQSEMEKGQSQCTEKRDYFTVKRDQLFTANQEHQSRNNKEHRKTNNQELNTTNEHQHKFFTGQQQCPLSNKLQSSVGNKSQKPTDTLINTVESDNEMKLKIINEKQFHKEKVFIPDTEQTRKFPGEHLQKHIKKTPKLMARNDQRLSAEQQVVKQGQQQQIISQDQQVKGKQGHRPKEEQAQQSTVKEVKGIVVSCCLSAPEGNKQPAVEPVQKLLSERDQQQFTTSTLELSTELNQEIVLQKFKDTRTKEVKWLPLEQNQRLVTEKEWKLTRLPVQSTSHYEEELLEHSSLFLLSELSKAGFETSFNSSTHSILRLAKKIQQTSTVNTTAFETSCNSSTQSILLCAKKMQQKSTLNNTVLHRSYMEDSIIKRVPIITEAPIYETLEDYKLQCSLP